MVIRKRLVLAATGTTIAVSSALGAQPIGSVHADSGSTPIVACGTIIDTPGTYTLRSDLSGCSSGIVITSPQVVLDFSGYSISGIGSGVGLQLTSAAAGDTVEGSAPGPIDVFLGSSASLSLRSFGVGVEVQAGGVSISGVGITGVGNGFDVAGPQTQIQQSYVDSYTGVGFDLDAGSDGSVCTGCDTSGGTSSSGAAYRVAGTNDRLQSSSFYTSGSSTNVDVVAPDVVVDNVFEAGSTNGSPSSGMGILVEASGSGAVITNSTVTYNKDGIVLTSGVQGATVKGITAYSNGEYDYRDDNPSCGSNTWSDNNGRPLQVHPGVGKVMNPATLPQPPTTNQGCIGVSIQSRL